MNRALLDIKFWMNLFIHTIYLSIIYKNKIALKWILH